MRRGGYRRDETIPYCVTDLRPPGQRAAKDWAAFTGENLNPHRQQTHRGEKDTDRVRTRSWDALREIWNRWEDFLSRN